MAALFFCACGPSVGQPCQDDATCGDALVCQKPAGAANGVCSFRYSGPGERCLGNGDCAAGLFCSNDLSTDIRQFAGVCQAQQGEGAPCLRSIDCAPPLACGGQEDDRLGTCR